MLRHGFLLLVSVVSLALMLVTCGGPGVRVDPSARIVQAHGAEVYLSYQYGPVPDTWEPITIEGNDAAWHDRATHGVIHVDHSCHRSEDTPLAALVQHLLIGFTERQFELEETIPFDGREARHVIVRARLDGVPMMLDLYVMKKDGCVFDLGYVAPPEAFARGVTAFEAFVRGFRTISTGTPTRAAQGGGP